MAFARSKPGEGSWEAGGGTTRLGGRGQLGARCGNEGQTCGRQRGKGGAKKYWRDAFDVHTELIHGPFSRSSQRQGFVSLQWVLGTLLESGYRVSGERGVVEKLEEMLDI